MVIGKRSWENLLFIFFFLLLKMIMNWYSFSANFIGNMCYRIAHTQHPNFLVLWFLEMVFSFFAVTFYSSDLSQCHKRSNQKTIPPSIQCLLCWVRFCVEESVACAVSVPYNALKWKSYAAGKRKWFFKASGMA